MPLSVPYSVTARTTSSALAEPVDPAFALLVAGRVPRQVVVDDGLEVFLQVHAFGQAVGRDQHRPPRLVAGQVPDPRFALVGRKHAGDGGDRVGGAEALGQVLGDVFGGVDEPAEDDRVVALEQQLRDHLGQQRELGVGVVPSRPVARLAKRFSRLRCAVSPSPASPSAPGVASADSLVSSSGRSSTAERPSRSASATSCASRFAALVRRVAAAARGEEASARSSASADQYRTRCLSWPPSGSRTVSRAYCEHVVEQLLVAGDSEYGPFLGQPVLGERRVLIEVGADVGAAALHEMAGQPLAALHRFEVDEFQARAQQGQQVAEALLLAAVRGGGDQDQVPGRGLWRGRVTSSWRSIRDRPPVPSVTQVCASSMISRSGQPCQNCSRSAGALDEVGGHDDVAEPVEQGLALQQPAFQPADRAGQHQLGVDAELRGQLPLPLLGQRRAAQHRQAGRVALLQQLGGDQAGLDGLADADVVGDQQPDRVLPQRHQQRDELVGAGLHGEPGQRPERPGAGPEPDPQCRAQQPGADRACPRRRGRAPRTSPS